MRLLQVFQPGQGGVVTDRSQLSLALPAVPNRTKPGEIESWARRASIFPLVGVDEAGRGPLAGPVVAAAVALPRGKYIRGLNDSKQLTEAMREQLFERIKAVADGFGVGVISAADIDRLGISAANYAAMTIAVELATSGGIVPELVLVDGRHTIPELARPQRAIIKGDGRSWNIAAASVLAKITRDRLMMEYHTQYPNYGFAQHKGYGTAKHLAALSQHGPCPIHRMTFAPVKKASK